MRTIFYHRKLTRNLYIYICFSSHSAAKETIVNITETGRFKCYFCSYVVFNLSRKVLADSEINILDKSLGFVPTSSSINEADVHRDFDDIQEE